MLETSHDARSGLFFTVDGADKGWYADGVRALSAVIIKYLRNKGLVFSAFLGTVARRCVTPRLKPQNAKCIPMKRESAMCWKVTNELQWACYVLAISGKRVPSFFITKTNKKQIFSVLVILLAFQSCASLFTTAQFISRYMIIYTSTACKIAKK